MSDKLKNPLAFPGETPTRIEQGVSLRDYFAGQALMGLVCESLKSSLAAQEAYEYADAMLEERAVRVKALDLSHALQHALLAGQMGILWENYDPTECDACRRLEDLQARCGKLEAAAREALILLADCVETDSPLPTQRSARVIRKLRSVGDGGDIHADLRKPEQVVRSRQAIALNNRSNEDE